MKIIKIYSLKSGWQDKDNLLLHVSFQLLKDYIDKEEPKTYIDWNADEEHKAAWKEIKYLYKWWTELRPKRKNPLEVVSDNKQPYEIIEIPNSKNKMIVSQTKEENPEYYKASKRHDIVVKKWWKEDQKYLHRLIDIRKYLWT